MLFGYDASGNVSSVTPPIRPAHTFGYTPVDLEELYTPPALGGPVATSYAYNLDRQLETITRPDGATVQFTYEATSGRLQTRTASADTVTYGYHPTAGTLTTLTGTAGQHLGYAYDGALRTGATWSGPVAGSVGTSYDAFLRVSGTTVNGAHGAVRLYDDDGLLETTGALTLTRHPAHGLVSATTLGTVTDSRTYTEFGELETYTATADGTPALAITYDLRDDLGRLEDQTETVLGGLPQTREYEYDARGRLELVTTEGTAWVLYTYDENGNRLTRQTSGGGFEGGASYDDQDRLLTYAGATYTYSANGDLETKTVGGQTTTYTYDALGNLRHVTLPGGTAIDYVIDPENRRVGKQVDGVLEQGFLYEDHLRVAAELDGAGTVVSRFVYGTRVNVPEYLVQNGTTYRILTDHLGSPRLVLDASDGTVVQRMEYDEFGRVVLDTNPGFQPFGFAGGLYDRDTGLVRFGARDYDPQVGRWAAKDPIGLYGGDLNLFGYSISDPINYRDGDGLLPTAVIGAIAGGVGAAITSGGDPSAVVVGAALGFVAGAAAPFVAVNLAAAGLSQAAASAASSGSLAGIASGVGQVAGNVVGGRGAFCNFSLGAVAGAAIGGGVASGANIVGGAGGLATRRPGIRSIAQCCCSGRQCIRGNRRRRGNGRGRDSGGHAGLTLRVRVSVACRARECFRLSPLSPYAGRSA